MEHGFNGILSEGTYKMTPRSKGSDKMAGGGITKGFSPCLYVFTYCLSFEVFVLFVFAGAVP